MFIESTKPTNEKKPEKDYAFFWDIGVIITLVTGVMYILGWTYWFSFFYYFGIRQEFINLNFEQVISTTLDLGFSGFIFLILIVFSLGLNIVSLEKIEDITIERGNFVRLLSLLVGFFGALYYPSYFIHIMILILIMSFLFRRHHFFKRRISINLHKKSSLFFVLIIVFSILLNIYGTVGEKRAERLANNQSGYPLQNEWC